MASQTIEKNLERIQSTSSPQELLALLKNIKNELIGDVSKKEQSVKLGLFDVLEDIIKVPSSLTAKRNTDNPSVLHDQLRHDESACTQAIQIAASLISAGPQFLDPLFHSNIIVVLTQNVHLTSTHPQIVLAALRALVAISSILRCASNTCALTRANFSDTFFSHVDFESLRVLLLMRGPGPHVHTQANLVATLLGRLSIDIKHRAQIAQAGIIDALATRFASFAVAEGLAVPGAEEACRQYNLEAYFPAPEYRVKLALILEAISNIIGNSKYLACMLIYSPAILAVFPLMSWPPILNEDELWLNITPASECDSEVMGAMDYMIPLVTVQYDHLFSDSNPNPNNIIPSVSDPLSVSSNAQGHMDSEQESPLVPFLIFLCRTRKDALDRLMAISVLAALFTAGCGTKASREASIGLLVIPVVLDIMREYDPAACSSYKPSVDSKTTAEWYIIETAPLVLSRLIQDNSTLQKAAFDGQAIKRLAHLLTTAYTPCPETQIKRWSPKSIKETSSDFSPMSCRLGDGAQVPLMAHNLKVRENTLRAIACLAAGREKYRKALHEDHPVIGYISESLHVFPTKPKTKDKDRSNNNVGERDRSYDSEYGIHTLDVIEAACHAVRVLSRSTKILRTALVDYAVHEPVSKLLQSENLELAISASAVMCNLVVEASPLRAPLIENHQVIPTLAKLTHSPNPDLRLNAIWALHHLVDYAPMAAKRQAFSLIEPEWLVRMISDDAQDNALAEAQKASTSDVDNDINMHAEGHSDVESTTEFMQPGPAPAELGGLSNSSIPFLNQHKALLRVVGELELNPLRKARREDLAIQEHSLGFIRNLIGASTTESNFSNSREIGEIVDMIVAGIGQERLFQLLKAKLKSRCLRPFARRQPTDGNASPEGKSRILYPQPNIVVAVIYILAHIAGSTPLYRNAILEQDDILKMILPYITSPEPKVRQAICQLIINLTCSELHAMGHSSLEDRCHILHDLGFSTKLLDLQATESVEPIKELLKLACRQLQMVAR
ncbi:hypothetical protein Cpir12675_004421 [Ceratocystis pirilliformis]|uniref:Armadillo repeat-containing protein 8 n=1 Tax=Ceratocystis pirilliformis TaxID=259994 RepID=A0ABR3YXT7_9PEZI